MNVESRVVVDFPAKFPAFELTRVEGNTAARGDPHPARCLMRIQRFHTGNRVIRSNRADE